MAKLKHYFLIITAILCVFVSVSYGSGSINNYFSEAMTQADIDRIDKVVQENMNDGKIPGISLVVVKDNKELYKRGYGYSDVANSILVDSNTVFELGSNSKAFTALGVLKLENDGLLDLNDLVEEHIPWFEMKYQDTTALITIEHVMNHTSGIPFNSIDNIEESNSEGAIEEAVRTLIGMKLQSRPGERFSYASINYDILGLIIENVSHQSYETYIFENVLAPMKLVNTYLYRDDVPLPHMAKGYKIGFLNAKEYEAPMFPGNKPAGYILSNGNDMSKWLMIQLGVDDRSAFDHDLIESAHVNRKFEVGNDVFYSAGWYIDESSGVIFHGGNNPNFSSSILIDIKNGIAIAVLANLNSPFTRKISNDVFNVIKNEPVAVESVFDMYMQADKIAVTAIVIAVFLILLMIFLIARAFIQLFNKKRVFTSLKTRGIIGILVSLCFLGGLGWIIHKAPELFLGGVTWKSVGIWAPKSLPILSFIILSTGLMACINIAVGVMIPMQRK